MTRCNCLKIIRIAQGRQVTCVPESSIESRPYRAKASSVPLGLRSHQMLAGGFYFPAFGGFQAIQSSIQRHDASWLRLTGGAGRGRGGNTTGFPR